MHLALSATNIDCTGCYGSSWRLSHHLILSLCLTGVDVYHIESGIGANIDNAIYHLRKITPSHRVFSIELPQLLASLNIHCIEITFSLCIDNTVGGAWSGFDPPVCLELPQFLASLGIHCVQICTANMNHSLTSSCRIIWYFRHLSPLSSDPSGYRQHKCACHCFQCRLPHREQLCRDVSDRLFLKPTPPARSQPLPRRAVPLRSHNTQFHQRRPDQTYGNPPP